jgi:hypothetical protein
MSISAVFRGINLDRGGIFRIFIFVVFIVVRLCGRFRMKMIDLRVGEERTADEDDEKSPDKAGIHC